MCLRDDNLDLDTFLIESSDHKPLSVAFGSPCSLVTTCRFVTAQLVHPPYGSDYSNSTSFLILLFIRRNTLP